MTAQISGTQSPETEKFPTFPTRSRSVVYSAKAIVSTTSPLATEAGLRVLRAGGNAADAAVAVAAVLNLVDPAMTGIGGDSFCLFHEARTKKVYSLNGSGRSPAGATLEDISCALNVKDPKLDQIPAQSVHSITIPGAARGWIDTVERFGSGKVSLQQILDPAIEMAEEGVPISKVAAYFWGSAEESLKSRSPNGFEVLKEDPAAPGGYRAPREGEIFRNPMLAKTFRLLAKEGNAGFYEGLVGEAIISAVKKEGGYHTLADLKYHADQASEDLTPMSIRLQDNRTSPPKVVDLWEHSPNGQGIVALMTLGIIRELEKAGTVPSFTVKEHNSARYLHVIIECLRIAFADAVWYITDPQFSKIDFQTLLSEKYLAQRAILFDPQKAATDIDYGSPAYNASDTVYFAVVDPDGNACSFINSVCDKFGSCIVPPGTGFALQNRGTGFRLDPDHPNVYAPGKRPYHTIIPAMVTNLDGSLHTVLGVMGGAMQPQGHVQVLTNMLKFKLDPQDALNAPRICISVALPGKQLETGHEAARTVFLEDGIAESVAQELREMGHQVKMVTGFARSMFGRGQVISVNKDPVTGQKIYSAGSDGRGDGAAVPL
ncbi:lincomycin-condensing protein [Melanomma pulvis-pyrius CBS 109.77]|uniref:Lincomycin-condensing protein n=1 Tax=Melanomma pulvis-pyrius CBS 109.77 TaxID=1314802 RepID=A0A6A6XHL0_9PLEO|nr:lincomycin-condensing protein [Melanomma pulvis-pyrius CBS 109.77]